jgi:lipopolysaccharide transport system permease protein
MSKQVWTEIITPKKTVSVFNLKELLNYRDLISLFVKRDFVTLYKQTILGPFWYVITPIVQTVIYTMMFGNIFSISDSTGIPAILFYLSGSVTWAYFSQSVIKTSNTFSGNADIFGKVYFPRLVVPISVLISNLIGFGIQLLLFVLFFLYYYFFSGVSLSFNPVNLLWIPVLLLNMALLGLGIGLIVSSLTTKYKDFKQFIGFGIQLLMFMSPVIVPMSIVNEKFPDWSKPILEYNPMTPIIEGFRAAFFENYVFDFSDLIYSGSVAIVLFVFGFYIFGKTEQNFMDTV